MRYIWITVFAFMLNACATVISNGSKFVSTPVENEIRTVVYSTKNAAGTNTWKLTNDDIRIRRTVKNRSGKVTTDGIKKMIPNDLNWVIYNLEEANFADKKSVPTRRSSAVDEVLTIITNEGTLTYTQNSTTRFPDGFQKVVNLIPGF